MGPGDARQSSSFVLHRRRLGAANRFLFVGISPLADRGRRVLYVDYDDGREETYVFVPGAEQGPMRASYRVADPFISTWQQIEPDDSTRKMRPLGDYEILGLRPTQQQGEPVYQLSLQSLTPRGYARTEVSIAARDFALLEKREYENASDPAPEVIVSVPRASIVRFGEHWVPERMSYQYPAAGVRIDVALQHERLPEGSDAAFYPASFHLAPLAPAPGASE